eukprot:scaffold15318_cov125-Isochrysis_galbana.AAC.8
MALGVGVGPMSEHLPRHSGPPARRGLRATSPSVSPPAPHASTPTQMSGSQLINLESPKKRRTISRAL